MSFLSHIVDKPTINLLSKFILGGGVILERSCSHNFRQLRKRFHSSNSMLSEPFLPKRALILRKFSRLEYERFCHRDLTEEQLASNLSQRGSAYETLKHYDRVQKSCLLQIESALLESNIEYITVDRFGFTDEKVDWADVVITSGGDGTFLAAASKVPSRDKPVIGINSDPTKSVGSLCLPSKYSNNFDQVIKSLREGRYHWVYKQRLRVTLNGDSAAEHPKDLNDIRYNIKSIGQFLEQDESQDRITSETCRQRLQEISSYQRQSRKDNDNRDNKSMQHLQQQQSISTNSNYNARHTRQLRERALNEVFIGEILSARVSYYELSVDNNRMTKLKSSGLTVCTGTGSTSWYYNINKITEQQVKSIVGIINNVTGVNQVNDGDASRISEITRRFNDSLTFPPSDPIMAYSIRDPVDGKSGLSHSHRGFAKRVEVKSRMQDACLVLDGGQFYPFNDGSYAVFEMYDEDALKTISIDPQ